MVNINVIGRLAADAELKTSQKGTQFVQFRIGVDDYSNGKNDTAWFSVLSSTEQAIRLQSYLTKGKMINVHGTETLRTYMSKTGEPGVARDINATSIEFVNVGRRDDSATQTSTDKSAVSATQITMPSAAATATAAPTMSVASSSSLEDDLPF